ncbi:MAG: carboxylating nicotinate-nucleotide diphosphorylase [Deltaproteobacteria bacterium]|jgi:nicotinate-nucleotide pyrophosphorylase (carboxylating)|nr:carboxylating nicotinate-nucleotide diphosphorylase [Deltaproteobacteria bacterium]
MTAAFPWSTQAIVAQALAEDLGPGDLTTRLCVPASQRGQAFVAARAELIVSGLEAMEEAFRQVDPAVKCRRLVADGDCLGAGERAAIVEGPSVAILAAERTALNFLGRLSGVASHTRRFVLAAEAAKRPAPRVLDTRKTTPGLRLLEKAAVRHGGGLNHRFGLHDGILVKDNHIRAVGSVAAALDLVRLGAPHLMKIEIEVDDLEQLQEALAHHADAVLLDNMSPAQLQLAVATAERFFAPGPRRTLLEASGGVTLANIGQTAQAGVDYISVGSLTHGAVWADFGLDWS